MRSALGLSFKLPMRRSAWLALPLLLLALPPRLHGTIEATTMDEDEWMTRSANFARTLSTGDWRSTYQTGHPGVLTMWITTLTLGHPRTQALNGGPAGTRVGQSEDFMDALRTARPVFATLTAILAA